MGQAGAQGRMSDYTIRTDVKYGPLETIRRNGTSHYGMTRAEVGWVLEDNGPMVGIAEAIDGKVNRVYRIYQKDL